MTAKINLSEKEIKRIEKLAGYGLRDQDIADIIGYSEASIKRYCSKELKRGRSTKIKNVAKTAYRLAVEGKCPAMTMFFLKTQARWREQEKIDAQEPEKKTKTKAQLKTNDAIEASKIYQQIMSE